jgi:hypothetical protein
MLDVRSTHGAAPAARSRGWPDAVTRDLLVPWTAERSNERHGRSGPVAGDAVVSRTFPEPIHLRLVFVFDFRHPWVAAPST